MCVVAQDRRSGRASVVVVAESGRGGDGGGGGGGREVTGEGGSRAVRPNKGRWRLSTVGGPWSGTWHQLVVVEAELS